MEKISSMPLFPGCAPIFRETRFPRTKNISVDRRPPRQGCSGSPLPGGRGGGWAGQTGRRGSKFDCGQREAAWIPWNLGVYPEGGSFGHGTESGLYRRAKQGRSATEMDGGMGRSVVEAKQGCPVLGWGKGDLEVELSRGHPLPYIFRGCFEAVEAPPPLRRFARERLVWLGIVPSRLAFGLWPPVL